jgi:osmoprotectant transport system substrate-binding protein
MAVAVVATLVAVVGAPAAALGRPPARALHDDVVTIGSFDFAESRLLAEIYGQAIEADGVKVRRVLGIGPRELVFPALAGGLLELVPEYAGAALRFTSLGEDGGGEVDATRERLTQRLRGDHLRALDSSPAQDVNTFVITQDTAATYQLESLSDLARVSDELVFGGPPECRSRRECLPGLERVYGIDFREVLLLDAGGPTTKQALRTGAVDVALLFSTDPDVEGEFVALADDRGLQPAENVTPLVRTEVLERFGPALAERLDAVSGRLTTDVLRRLNGEVARGVSARRVAARWLTAEGLR